MIDSNWPLRDINTGKDTVTQALALGLGSIFNHSTYNQNVAWERNIDAQTITYRALRDIELGEELCVSYGSRLWFIDSEANQEVFDEGKDDGMQTISRIEWP